MVAAPPQNRPESSLPIPVSGKRGGMSVDKRVRLSAGEIEARCLASLQGQPWLRHIAQVKVQPYRGRKSWTWELAEVEPDVGRIELDFAMPEIRKLQREIDLE